MDIGGGDTGREAEVTSRMNLLHNSVDELRGRLEILETNAMAVLRPDNEPKGGGEKVEQALNAPLAQTLQNEIRSIDSCTAKVNDLIARLEV